MKKQDTTPAAQEAPVDNFDYLSGETAPDFGEVEVGGKKWRTLQIFSEDHKTRRKTPLEMGGFGIRTSDATIAGLGEVWAVPFATGDKEEMMTFTNFTAALVGWTDKYTALKGTMPDDTGMSKGYFQPVPQFVNDIEIKQAIDSGALPVGAEIRSSSCIDLFFVLKGDAKREVYRVRIKNHELMIRIAGQINAARALAQKAKAPVCALWLEWKLADAIETGKAPNTAMVNGIELASGAIEDSMKATRAEYFGEFDPNGVELPGLKARAEEVKAFLDDPADPYFIQAAKQLRANSLNRLPALPAFARLAAPSASPAHATQAHSTVIEGEVTL